MPKLTLTQIEKHLLTPIVRKIIIELKGPDDMLIEKLKDGEHLYIIAKGECSVDFRRGNLNMQDTSQNWRKALVDCGKPKQTKSEGHGKTIRLLQGQLFGEISLIYNCVTTASVIAKKYSTIGKMPKKDFNDMSHKYPEILKSIKEGIFKYSDRDMKFIKMALRQLPFFAHLQDTDTVFYDVIYKMKTVEPQKGPYKEIDDPIMEIYILEHGIAEIYLTINGKDIVLERLFRGSVINYKSIFQKNVKFQVNLRFVSDAVVKILEWRDLEELRKLKTLDKEIKKFEIKVNRIKSGPLDYILSLPKKVYRELIERTREKLLFDKQDVLMERLEEEKKHYKKHQGLDMDDKKIATTLHKLQAEEVKDDEVVLFYTKMNHLELRVKNIAVTKLITG